MISAKIKMRQPWVALRAVFTCAPQDEAQSEIALRLSFRTWRLRGRQETWVFQSTGLRNDREDIAVLASGRAVRSGAIQPPKLAPHQTANGLVAIEAAGECPQRGLSPATVLH